MCGVDHIMSRTRHDWRNHMQRGCLGLMRSGSVWAHNPQVPGSMERERIRLMCIQQRLHEFSRALHELRPPLANFEDKIPIRREGCKTRGSGYDFMCGTDRSDRFWFESVSEHANRAEAGRVI